MNRRLNFIFITLLYFFLCSLALAGNQSSNLYNKNNDFLSAEKAFKYEIYKSKDLKYIDVIFDIAPGYYLYKSKMDLKILPFLNSELILGNGKIKKDEFFGEQEVFYNQTTLKLLTEESISDDYEVSLQYQGCSDNGLCYPPITKVFKLNELNNLNKPQASETDTIISKFSNQNFILTLIGFFISGLLLSLTPCVLPMVPILSGIIIASNPKHSTRLTICYVSGITFTYTLLGIIAGLTGTLLSSSLQNTNFILFTCFLYFIFAISMFGLFELTLPSSIQNKIGSFSRSFELENSFNVFILGLLSSLILSPCVAPPLAAAILYIGQSNNYVLGGGSLFFMSLGMSIPLLAIGIFSLKIIPKPGEWMINIKKLIGFILLAMAIYIIRPLLSEFLFFSSLILIFLISIFYFIWSNKDSKIITKLIQIIISIIIVGLIIIETKPSWLNANNYSEYKSKKIFSPINNNIELQNLLTDSNKKPIILDFYADWCVACLEYEKFTFKDPEVINLMSQFELLQIDVTENNDDHQNLLKKFNLFGPPGIIFFNAEGNEIKELRTIGFKNAKDFSSILRRANK